jgi:hypothetical protein
MKENIDKVLQMVKEEFNIPMGTCMKEIFKMIDTMAMELLLPIMVWLKQEIG